MRKTLRAAVFTLALCAPAAAGDIPNPPAPQPPSITVPEEPANSGDGTQAADSGSETQAADSLTEAALNLIESVLALF